MIRLCKARRDKPADAGDFEAHESVRRWAGRQPARGMGQGVCDRPAGAIRRHHRGEPRLDGECAEAIAEIFSEVIVAPEFSPAALAVLQKKKNLRLLQILKCPTTVQPWDVRSVGADSFLLQQRDLKMTTTADLKVVTKRQPTGAELKAMLFGWRVVKHLKSNAILYCGADRTLGVGAGQMSRVDASRIAIWKTGEAKLDLKGSVVCSDAFFPFPTGCSRRRTRVRRLRSSRAARCGTPRSLRRRTRGAWRWRSPARGISGIESVHTPTVHSLLPSSTVDS